MNLVLLAVVVIVSAAYFGWLALTIRRTPVDPDPFPQVHARSAVPKQQTPESIVADHERREGPLGRRGFLQHLLDVMEKES